MFICGETNIRNYMFLFVYYDSSIFDRTDNDLQHIMSPQSIFFAKLNRRNRTIKTSPNFMAYRWLVITSDH